MLTVFIVVLVAAALVGLVWLAVRGGGAWARFRGDRVVTCPENGDFVAVQVDARHAAATALGGERELRLRDCTRWPEKQGCGQECLAQIEAAPMDCLARTMLVRWYEGASCVVCGKDIGTIDWHTAKPALRAPDGRTLDWNEVPAERLPEVLATHSPVCWDCHVVGSVVREHPERVVVRPAHRGPGIPGPMPGGPGN
jgi:hypothetical protein